MLRLLKDVGYAPKCCTNLVALEKAQRAGVGIMFKAGTTKMKATIGGRVCMVGDSESTGITELTGMRPVGSDNPVVSFFTAGEDNAVQLAHRLKCHTAVSTLAEMERTNAVRGLGALKSTKKVGNICEACVDGKEMK